MEITDFFPTYIKLWRYCKCAMVLEINIYLCEPIELFTDAKQGDQ